MACDKKKIVFVAKSMCVGGVEKTLVDLSQVFDYSRYDLDVILIDKSGALLDRIDNRANVYSIDELICKKSALHYIKNMWNRFLARLNVQYWYINEFYSQKKNCKITARHYDCAIAYHGVTSSVVAAVLYRLSAKKKVLWVHGDYKYEPYVMRFLNRKYRKFNKTFCVSNGTKNVFLLKYPNAGGNAEVAYNIISANNVMAMACEEVDVSFLSISILTVGRFAVEKGQIMIPKATRILLDSGYDIHWYLVGDGSMRHDVEEEIKKHDVEERVILLGTKENPYPFIKYCDIYVQPSFSEGYCTTTMEAKILGKPIVTTDAPGMREQFTSGENGLIVDEMTPEAIAEGVKYLIDRPEVRQRFIENLKKEEFSGSNELQKLYDFIESLNN